MIAAMIETLTSPDFMQRLAGSLLHFIWQGAVIAMIAALVLRALASRSAEWRYGVSIVALVLMLVAPVVTFALYAQTGMATLKLLRVVGESTKSTALSTAQTAATASWTQWIVLAWFIGVVIGSIRLIAGWRMSRSLLRVGTTTVPSAIQQSFNEIMERLSLAKPVRLLASLRIDTPVAIGWLRPAVLLPISAITGLNEAQLRAVFAHELAHIRRHDFLVNLLQRCVEAVLFYHPAVWWLSSRIRSEREHCCDDLAVQICGDRSVYAQALLELERVRTAAPDLAVAATGGVLTRRIHRVLGYRIVNADWQSAVAALLFVVVWVLVGVWQSDTKLEAKTFAPPPVPAQAVSKTEPALPAAGAMSAIAAIVTAEPVQPLQSTIAEQPTMGAVEGVLRDNAGSPAPGARVLAVAVPADAGTVINSESIFLAPVTARTDGEGHYRLENMPPGSYYIVAGRVGFPTFYPGTADAGARKAVTVSAGATVPDIDFGLAAMSLGVTSPTRPMTASSQTVPATLMLYVSVKVEDGGKLPIFANGRFPRLRLTRVGTNTIYEMGLGGVAIGVALNMTFNADEYKVSVEDLPSGYEVKSITHRADEPGVRFEDVLNGTLKISQRAIDASYAGGDIRNFGAPDLPIAVTLAVRPQTTVTAPRPGPDGRLPVTSVTGTSAAMITVPKIPSIGSSLSLADRYPPDAGIYISGKPGILYADGSFAFSGVSGGLHRIVLYSMTVDGPRIAAADVLVTAGTVMRFEGNPLQPVSILPKPIFSAPVLSTRATTSSRLLDLASLTVRVLDDTTEQPVTSANVTLTGMIGSTTRYVGRTNPDLRMDTLLPGEYSLNAESSGYTTKTEVIRVGQGNTPLDIKLTRAPK